MMVRSAASEGSRSRKNAKSAIIPEGGTCPAHSVQSSEVRVQGSGCRVQGSGCWEQGAGCKVQGSGFRRQGLGHSGNLFSECRSKQAFIKHHVAGV
jgi:hypothetical protein